MAGSRGQQLADRTARAGGKAWDRSCDPSSTLSHGLHYRSMSVIMSPWRRNNMSVYLVVACNIHHGSHVVVLSPVPPEFACLARFGA